MQKLVSITSQGQLSIPQDFLRSLGVTGPVKAVISKRGDILEVRPRGDFWTLESSLQSSAKLSPRQLKEARDSFSREWPKL